VKKEPTKEGNANNKLAAPIWRGQFVVGVEGVEP
jgi:hypothetical protein